MSAVTEINPPHPSLILDRFAAVSGYHQLSPKNLHPCTATDYILRTETADILYAEMKDDRHQLMMPIGRFDPVVQAWRFPPELVAPDERQKMSQVGQYLYGQTRPFVMSERMLDAPHPVTVQARQKVAAVLAPLKPISWLERDGVVEQFLGPKGNAGSVLGADEYTMPIVTSHDMAYDRMSIERAGELNVPVAKGRIAIENGRVMLTYAGLQAESGRPGGMLRVTRALLLAVRSPFKQDIWLPNKDVITQKEWEAMAAIPELLGSLAVTDPRFSPEQCALVYNNHRGK